MTIDELRALCVDDTIMVTKHVSDRLRERGIKYSNIKRTIQQGEIVEDYPDDYPYPSCLISDGDIHVIAATGSGKLWFITAYRPDPEKWVNGNKIRKKV